MEKIGSRFNCVLNICINTVLQCTYEPTISYFKDKFHLKEIKVYGSMDYLLDPEEQYLDWLLIS